MILGPINIMGSNSCSSISVGCLSFFLLAWPMEDFKFSSRNMSSRKEVVRKYQGEGITCKFSSESKGDWRSGVSQKNSEPQGICQL